MTEPTHFLNARFPNGTLAMAVRDFGHACQVMQEWREVFVGNGEPEFTVSRARSVRGA